MAQNKQDQIREHAYFLWQNEGCQEGREMEYWLQAEQLISGKKKAPAKKKAVSAVASAPKKKTTTAAKKTTKK